MYRIRKTVLNIFVVSVFFQAGHVCHAAQVAVIAHLSVQENSLDKNQLYDVFSGEVRTWEDGTKIQVWDLGECGEIRDSFYDFMGIRPSRMKSIWMRRLLTGEGEPPDEAGSQEEMVEKIIATPGSIGYIDMKLIDEQVKLLLVIEEE